MRLDRHALLHVGSLSLALALTGCALTPESEGWEDTEPVAEAEGALSSVIASYASSPATAIDATNGKKVVLVNGVFHAVFSVSGVVRYTSSADGLTWTASQIVDATSAQNPTVAVAANGTIGVAYVRSAVSGAGQIYYASKTGPGPWLPTLVTSDGLSTSGRTPSLFADGSTMHLAWARAINIVYKAFPAGQSTPLAAAEIVNSVVPQGVTSSLPALMVGPGPSGTRVVRVAYFEKTPAQGPFSAEIRFWIAQRGATNWPYPTYSVSNPYATSATAVSTSIDVDPVTGDAFAAAAWLHDGVGTTFIVHENTLNPATDYEYDEIVPNVAAIVSVAARSEGCQSRFRVMVSTPWSSYGTTWERRGYFTPGGALAWVDPAAVNLVAPSRAGTALFGSKAIPNTNQTRVFYGVLEQISGPGTYQYHHAYDAITTPAPCE